MKKTDVTFALVFSTLLHAQRRLLTVFGLSAVNNQDVAYKLSESKATKLDSFRINHFLFSDGDTVDFIVPLLKIALPLSDLSFYVDAKALTEIKKNKATHVSAIAYSSSKGYGSIVLRLVFSDAENNTYFLGRNYVAVKIDYIKSHHTPVVVNPENADINTASSLSYYQTIAANWFDRLNSPFDSKDKYQPNEIAPYFTDKTLQFIFF